MKLAIPVAELYDPLTPEEQRSLVAFAEDHGRTWKRALRDHWWNATVPYGYDANLYALRNSHGQTWLANYRLPKD